MAIAMTRHVVIESPSPTMMNRKQPLLFPGSAAMAKDEKDGRNGGRRIGEVAGGTTAECAAVCCCCPCAMMHLLVLAVYKVPRGLCKKALKKNKRKRLLKKKKKNLMEENKSGPKGNNHDDSSSSSSSDGGDDDDDDNDHKGVVDLDSEMWDRFYGAGFWRSYSQRED